MLFIDSFEHLAAAATTLAILFFIAYFKPKRVRVFHSIWNQTLVTWTKCDTPALPSIALEQVEPTVYTRNWWTDEKRYQLERRAIFSKVGNQEQTIAL